MAKTKAVDLHAQLQESLAPAESAVVSAALAFVEDGKEAELREACTNLLAIKAGLAAMSRHVTKKPESKPAPAPKPAASGPVPVSKPAVAAKI